MSRVKESINVLDAWHLVEFFQAYSIPEGSKEGIEPSILNYRDLIHDKDSVLPWLTPVCRDLLGIDPNKSCTYTLYLGLFDKYIVDEIVSNYLNGGGPLRFSADEVEHRTDNNGITCFAKLNLDEFGEPCLHGFSISTLPWAIGRLLSGEVGNISHGCFEASCHELSEIMRNWRNTLPAHSEYEEKRVVDSDGLLSLIQELYGWVGLSTSDLKREKASVGVLQLVCNESKVSDDSRGGKTDAEKVESEVNLPILNSFYLKDLELASQALSSGRASSPLLSYLEPSKSTSIDLYSNESMPLIRKRLAPDQTPEGRWLSDPAHNMSLMQQFAINTAFNDLDKGGLLSVNGPPGTGKTTLLRDIVAQNLVDRAKILASLAHAKDGLTQDGYLIDELTGFEMVVASSNNAAVENISRELPMQKSLADCYKDVQFFKPVANQLKAKERKNILLPLDEGKLCWGNISAVLGSKANRNKFLSRFFYKNCYEVEGDSKNTVPRNRKPSEDFLNFWQHQKDYTGPTFYEAKQDFHKRLTMFIECNEKLQELDELNNNVSLDSHRDMMAVKNKEISELKSVFESDQIALSEYKQKRDLRKKQEEEILVSIERLKVNIPSIISRLFNRKQYIKYKEMLSSKLQDLEDTKRSIRFTEGIITEKEIEEKSLRRKLDQITCDIESEETKFQKNREYLAILQERFKDYQLPNDDDDLKDRDRQCNACWQNIEINDLRSQVFASALQLHEAWIVEVVKNASFRRQICKISDVVQGKEREDALSVWQILFLFVPVISTTFASLGKMFSTLPSESIGWLMIDEAGQAVPQAAVGGLMRAKRAIVVGDPLQVEPVFTSSPSLVNYLMKTKLQSQSERWNPCVWSVQKLSDRVNPYGCMLDVAGEEQWIGIPLWVHRRCSEPMFSIANEVAYNSRMIHASYGPEDQQRLIHPQLGVSRWIHSSGKCVYKQYSSELFTELLAIILTIADGGGDLSQVYVISPFKSVVSKLKEQLYIQKDRFLPNLSWTKVQLDTFLNSNIGTVHTFQGKEIDTVILVLGCDILNSSGVNWAASKPNILNVAVTRAKKHLFVLGDSHMWSRQRYFDIAHSKLEK
ncbi:AAA domain-containing protein [Vibrio parahaemolyticus]